MNDCYLFREGHLVEVTTPLHRGMLYGDGFFESMRWHQGNIVLKHLHEDRIRRSADLLSLSLEGYSGLDTIEKALRQLPVNDHMRIRLVLLRAGTGFYLPEEHKTDIYITVQEMDGYYKLNETGFNCISYHDQYKAAGKYSCIKSTSSLLYVMAALTMKKLNAQEAIIYNSNGHIAEGSSTNLFLFSEGKIKTPAISDGCVDGVFRRFILSTARKSNWPIEEISLTEEDVLQADELWFSSSTRGLLWGGNLGVKKFRNSKAKEFFTVLMTELA